MDFNSYLRLAKAYLIAASGLPRMAWRRIAERGRPKALVLSVGGPNSTGAPLCRVLQRLGYSITVVAEAFPTRESPLIAGWKKLNCEEQPDEIIAWTKDELKPDIVCSDHRNFLLPTKAKILDALGFEPFGSLGPRTSNDKLAFRTALDDAGSPNLQWSRLSDADADSLIYPLVAKPARGTGSRGVRKLMTPAELLAFREGFGGSGEDSRWLVEQYIPGRQFDVEGVCRRGEYHILAVVEEYYRETAGKFPQAWYVFSPPVSDEMYAKITETAKQTLRACGVQAGAFHCELRVAEDGSVTPLDYSNRFGYPSLVSAAAEVDFIEAYVRTLEPDPYPEPEPKRKTIYQEYIATPEERAAFKRLVSENPDNVMSSRFLSVSVGDVLVYGNVCLKAADLSALDALLQRYGLGKPVWRELYSESLG